MVDTTSDPALMLNFKSKIGGIPTINLTGEEAIMHYPPLRCNITQDLEDNLDAPTTAPSHTSSGGAPAVPSPLVLRSIPTDSLIINKKEFSPKSIDRVKALMLKENRTKLGLRKLLHILMHQHLTMRKAMMATYPK